MGRPYRSRERRRRRSRSRSLSAARKRRRESKAAGDRGTRREVDIKARKNSSRGAAKDIKSSPRKDLPGPPKQELPGRPKQDLSSPPSAADDYVKQARPRADKQRATEGLLDVREDQQNNGAVQHKEANLPDNAAKEHASVEPGKPTDAAHASEDAPMNGIAHHHDKVAEINDAPTSHRSASSDHSGGDAKRTGRAAVGSSSERENGVGGRGTRRSKSRSSSPLPAAAVKRRSESPRRRRSVSPPRRRARSRSRRRSHSRLVFSHLQSTALLMRLYIADQESLSIAQ